MNDIVSQLQWYAEKKRWPRGLEPLGELLARAAAALSEAEKSKKEARMSALEEAAKVADEAAAMRERLYQENGASLNASKAAQALVIAANIRALQTEGQ